MEKAYSQIIGIPVSVEGEGKVGKVKEVIMNPETGKIEAFVLNKRTFDIVLPIDVIFWSTHIVIHSMNDIFQLDEIIRLRQLLSKHIWINKCKVETADGELVGHVYDYFVDSKMMVLTKILTVKTYFGLFKGGVFLIPRKEIIKIEKNVIIVRDLYKKYAIKEKKFEMSKGLKPDVA